jgi:NifU-like protein involved in Fe-S cluster formation
VNFDKYKALNKDPERLGIMENPDAVGTFENEGCGDNYEIYIKTDGEIITDAKFKTTGCGFGLAALQLTLDCAVGRSIEDAKNIPDEDIEAGIDGFPPARTHYIKEAKEALCTALEQIK